MDGAGELAIISEFLRIHGDEGPEAAQKWAEDLAKKAEPTPPPPELRLVE